MFVLGRTNTKEIHLISQDTAFIMNEYLMVEDLIHGSIPVEVVSTFALPMVVPSVLPEGSAVEFLNVLKIDATKPVFLAKAIVLKTLATPIMPTSKVRKPAFDEIKNILIHANPKDGFTLGTIQGTTQLQEQLPVELQNVAPRWENKQAVHQNGVPFFLDHHKFREYPHIGLFGTSGSGKTFGMRVIEEEIMKFAIPTLSFDPHMESVFDRPMAGLTKEQQMNYKGRYEIFYIGKNVGVRFSELSLAELVHLFEYVGALSEPQKAALESLYEKGDTIAYLKQKITDLKTAFEEYEKPKKEQDTLTPTQEQLYARFRNRVSGSATLQALSWKLDSLENTEIFNGDVLEVERALKQRKLCVIRGDIKRLQMLSSYMVKKFYKQRRAYQDARERGIEEEYFPMFYVVMDESHNFAPKHGFSPIGNVLKTIALEARKYGVFLVMVTQKPDALDETIVAQLNTKIIYRLNTASDMDMVKKETNLTDEEVQKLPDLLSGSCFVSSPILPKTFAVRFRTTFTESPNTKDPYQELDQFSVNQNQEELANYLEGKLPIHLNKIAMLHSEANQVLTGNYSVQDISDTLKQMATNGKVVEKRSPFGLIYEK